MSSADIRKACSSDAVEIAQLHEASWLEVFSSEFPYPENGAKKWGAYLVDNNNVAYVVVTDDQIVGYLSGTQTSNGNEITDLFVTQNYRKRGLGRLLVKACLDDCKNIVLWVAESNAAAKALYESMGFIPTGDVKQEPRRKDGASLISMTKST